MRQKSRELEQAEPSVAQRLHVHPREDSWRGRALPFPSLCRSASRGHPRGRGDQRVGDPVLGCNPGHQLLLLCLQEGQRAASLKEEGKHSLCSRQAARGLGGHELTEVTQEVTQQVTQEGQSPSAAGCDRLCEAASPRPAGAGQGRESKALKGRVHSGFAGCPSSLQKEAGTGGRPFAWRRF